MSTPSGSIFYQDYADPMNDPKIKFLTYDEMIRAGVMPWDSNSHDMNQLLSGLAPEEARKFRRKFRKLWRKKLKEMQAKNGKHVQNPAMANNLNSHEAKRLGLGQKKPTKEQRRRRREVLRDEFLQSARLRADQLKSTGTDVKDPESR